jgi:ABC-2 type transport system permease protein
MLPFIFILPIVQTLVLVYAASFDLKVVNLTVVDYDNSVMSRDVEQHFLSSPFFVTEVVHSDENTEYELTSGEKHAVMKIPVGFEKGYVNGESQHLQLLVDAVNQQSAGLINAYVASILQKYQKEILVESGIAMSNTIIKNIDVKTRFWYNQELNYKHYMLPGILVILVTIIGSFLTALNIVREREIGTMEQINVTPVKKWQFMIGKLTPFLVIALFELALGLAIGVILFSLPIVGSLISLFVFALVYLIAAVAFGLLLANEAKTQQQVMFTTFFFFVVFVLMSGIFTPVESMPKWAQVINYLNPLFYFMKAIRMILLKGSSLAEISSELFSLLSLGIAMFSVAVLRYRKVS